MEPPSFSCECQGLYGNPHRKTSFGPRVLRHEQNQPINLKLFERCCNFINPGHYSWNCANELNMTESNGKG